MAACCGRWHHRHPMFKLATAGLVMSAALFSAGFSLPRWYKTAGLWTSCGIYSCVDSVPVVEAPWLGAVQGLLCLALVGYTVCLGAEIYQDLWTTPPTVDNRVVETVALFTGILSLLGAVLFVSKTSDTLKALEAWSFWLVISASIILLIAAVLMAISRKLHAQYTLSRMTRAGVISPVSATSPPKEPLSSAFMLAPATGILNHASQYLNRVIVAANCSRWHHRHPMFKFATAGLVMSAALFTTGFCLPRWYQTTGLWTRCDIYSCIYSIPVIEAPWLGVIQGMLCLSLAGYILCLGTEIYQDLWTSPPPPDSNAVEVLAMCTGLLSMVGPILYISKTSDRLKALEAWSFWLVISSSIFVLISAVLLAISRRIHAQFTASRMNGASIMIQPVQATPLLEDHFSSNVMLAPAMAVEIQASQMLETDLKVPPPVYRLPPPYPYSAVLLEPQFLYPMPQITAPQAPNS